MVRFSKTAGKHYPPGLNKETGTIPCVCRYLPAAPDTRVIP